MSSSFPLTARAHRAQVRAAKVLADLLQDKVKKGETDLHVALQLQGIAAANYEASQQLHAKKDVQVGRLRLLAARMDEGQHVKTMAEIAMDQAEAMHHNNYTALQAAKNEAAELQKLNNARFMGIPGESHQHLLRQWSEYEEIRDAHYEFVEQTKGCALNPIVID